MSEMVDKIIEDTEKKKDELVDKKKLIDRYYSNMKKLEDSFPFIATACHFMGVPRFVRNKQFAAGVGYDAFSQTLFYEWGIEQFNELSDKEVRGTIVHEALHLLLKHYSLMDNVLNFPGKDIESISSVQRHSIINIAMDIIINDWIKNYIEEKNCENEVALSDKLAYGDILEEGKRFPWNLYSSEHTFIRLLNKMRKNNELIEIVDGNTVRIFGQEVELISDHSIAGDVDDANDDDVYNERSMIDNILDEMAEKMSDGIVKEHGEDLRREEKKRSKNKQRELFAGSLIEDLLEVKAPLDLKELLDKILGKRIDHNLLDNWRRCNPKLISSYPDVILPYEEIIENQNRLEILFALDVSGSMSTDDIEKMVAIAKKHRADHDVSMIQFDVEVRPFDMDKMEVEGRGGTSFYNLLEHIKEHNPIHPDVIVVLTDGWGGPADIVDDEYINPDRWIWVLTEEYDNISDILEKIGEVVAIEKEFY